MDKVGDANMEVVRNQGDIVPRDFAAAVKNIKLAILQSRARAAHAISLPRPGHRRRPPRTRQRTQGTYHEERLGMTDRSVRYCMSGQTRKKSGQIGITRA